MTQLSRPIRRPHGNSLAGGVSRADVDGRVFRVVRPPETEPVPEGTELSIDICRAGPEPVVSVTGELDLAGEELLEAVVAHVRSTHRGPVAMDLGRVSFADTHGLSPALQQGVVVVAASPAVRRLLHLLGRPVPARGWAAPRHSEGHRCRSTRSGHR